MEPNGTPDSAENSQLFKAAKASIGNGANLLSNHNFLIASPDDIAHPSATPTDYVAGTQVFSNVFVATDIIGLTLIDGRLSWISGSFYMSAPNAGALENITEFVASVADFDGKPRTRGVSYALVGDEYRVTVGVDALEDAGAVLTPLGSVKFEQGSVATGHETESVSSRNLSDYAKINYTSSGGNSAFENMVAGIPLLADVGDTISTGTGDWRRIASNGDESDFIPLNGVWVEDFGAEEGGPDATQKIQDAIGIMRIGSCLKGYGEFFVSTILPKQATSIRSMRFKSLPTTAQVSHTPTIRIGDNINDFDGLLIDDVHIDGNRINHQNIDLLASGDGGMHGIHIRAKVRNVTIRDSSSNYCGTAGLALDWDENRPISTDAPSYEIADINVIRCEFNNNREHGSFGAYCQRVKYVDCNMMNNGNDLPGGPWTVNQGGHGAFTVANGYFGRGLDIESYNSVSGFTKVEVRGGDYSGNANGSIQFFDPAAFPSNRVAAAHCVIDNVITGPAVNSIDPPNNSTVNVQASPSATEYGMNGLSITNITLQGRIRINGVSGINISGTHVPVSGVSNGLDIFNSRRISTSLNTPEKIRINDIEDASNNPTITTIEGSSTTSVLLERYTQPVGGVSRITYRIRVNSGGGPGTSNAHKLEFPDGLPENVSREPVVFQKDATGSISGDISNYRPIAYTTDDNPQATSPDVYVNSTGTGNAYDLYVTVNVVAGREL
jgi:hypothetical protein